MTAYSTENIPPKPPKTTDAKYLTYRILIITMGNKRHCDNVDIYTDNLEETRKSCKKEYDKYLWVKRILFSYHEKGV